MLSLFKRLLAQYRAGKEKLRTRNDFIRRMRKGEEKLFDLLAADLIQNAIGTNKYGLRDGGERFMCIALKYTKNTCDVYGYQDSIREHARKLILEKIKGHGTLFAYLSSTRQLRYGHRFGIDETFIQYTGIPFFKKLVEQLRAKHEFD